MCLPTTWIIRLKGYDNETILWQEHNVTARWIIQGQIKVGAIQFQPYCGLKYSKVVAVQMDLKVSAHMMQQTFHHLPGGQQSSCLEHPLEPGRPVKKMSVKQCCHCRNLTQSFAV